MAACWGLPKFWLGYKFALVLEATQTSTVALAVVGLACAVAIVAEALVPRADAIALRSRPQAGVGALIAEIAIVVPVTGGEHRETILVGPVTALAVKIIPAAGGFQQRTGSAGSTYVGVQGAVLLVRGHMPAFWANAAVGAIGGTGLTVVAAFGSCVYAELGRTIHHSAPGVQATVLVAVGSFIFIAPAGGVGSVTAVFKLHALVGVVQVLRHPGLGADGDGLVHLAIAKICKGICGSIVFAAVLDARFFAR